MRYRLFSMRPSGQRGISLLMSLLLLVVLAVITITSIQTGGLQERIAGNTRDRTTTFNAAESALRDAEAYMSDARVLPLFDGSVDGHYRSNAFPGLVASSLPPGSSADATTLALWRDKSALAYIKTKGIEFGAKTGAAALPYLAQQPRFILEQMPGDRSRAITYRITSYAEGRDNSVVILQSYYTPPQDTVISP